MPVGLENVVAEVARCKAGAWQGRVVAVGNGTIEVSGLSAVAALGDIVEISQRAACHARGEILSIQGDIAVVLPDGTMQGVQLGDAVRHLGENLIAPDDSWLGKILDPYGRLLSGEFAMPGPTDRAIRGNHIEPTRRKPVGDRLETGMALFNTILPIARGQRLGLFAGSGVGKSTLLGKLVLGVQTDVVVLAMIGERSREVLEFVERVLGPVGLQKTVIVAATADQSAVLRRRCAWAAMAVAEHFRAQGRQVLFLADSLTRFAEAHREIALAAGERGNLAGYPPSTASLLTALCERAGPGPEHEGDITAIFSILVAGSDMEEPVADILRGVLDGHIVLDREIAERGRFPAVDVLRSVSRSLPFAATEAENDLISKARARLGCYARNEMMIRAGLYVAGSDNDIDRAIDSYPKLDRFIAENESEGISNSFRKLAECIAEPKSE